MVYGIIKKFVEILRQHFFVAKQYEKDTIKENLTKFIFSLSDLSDLFGSQHTPTD